MDKKLTEVTSYDEKTKYAIQAKLKGMEEGSSSPGNTPNLEIEAMSLVGGSQYSGSFSSSNWDPQEILPILAENKYAIEINSIEKITLKVGLLKFSLEKKRDNEEAFLKAKIIYLEKRVEFLDKSIPDRKHPLIVCSLSTTQQIHELKAIWDKQNISLDHKYFTLSENKKEITIREEGIYRFDVKFLSAHGLPLYPFLSVNNDAVMYFYGSGAGFQDASLNLIWPIPANAIISIGFQTGNEGHSIYINVNYNYHYLCITKL